MTRFLIKRLIQGIFVIFGLSIFIFVISRVVPGDPARLALGPRATNEAVQELREEMHLNDSLPQQYKYWITGAIQGDFGKSVNTKRTVVEDIKEFLPATIELVLVSGFILIIFSIILGVLAAKYKDTWIDALIRFSAYIGIAVPAFVKAIIFLLLFGLVWRLVPVLGRLSPDIIPPPAVTGLILIDSLLAGDLVAFWDALQHIMLPAIALSLGSLLQEARLLRSSMSDNMNKEYISVFKGFGIPKNVIMKRYLFKPSFIPVVSVMGLDLAALMGNAFLVEKIFNWPGLSRYGLNAMMTKDLNSISAVIIIIGLVFLTVNIIVDVIIAALDPRIRLGD
jgi:peptide/nickel transport system permease protein